MPSEIDSFKNITRYSLAKTNIEIPIIKEKTIMEIFFKLIILKFIGITALQLTSGSTVFNVYVI